jgi:hypothetical protein
MPANAATLRIVTSYQDQMSALRGRVTGYVQNVWGSLDSWRSADIDRFVRAVAPAITGGQRQVAALTDSYLAAVESTITGLPVRPVGVPANLVTDEAIRGVAAEDVYARTGPAVWSALSDGSDLPTAVEAGLQRALSMALTDLQLAKTHASRHIFGEKDHVVGYRRALTGRKACGLCAVASTQRYHKADLMPCHPGCGCSVVPIIGTNDPGQVIDAGQLEQVHQAINDRFGAFNSGARDIPGVSNPDGTPAQYRNVLVVHHHGEIGPVLGVRGQHFTGPSDLP